MTARARIQRGVPRGGQFAASPHGEAGLALSATRPDTGYEAPDDPVDHSVVGDHYPDLRGAKFTGWRDAAAIAKDVRADIKQAVAAGHLPASIGGHDLTYQVRSDKYAGGQAVNVTVMGMADRDLYDGRDDYGHRQRSMQARLLHDKVERIATAYNRSRSDSMTDYFDETYYCNVTLVDESGMASRLHEKSMDALVREHRAAKGAGADQQSLRVIMRRMADANAAYVEDLRQRSRAEEKARDEWRAEHAR